MKKNDNPPACGRETINTRKLDKMRQQRNMFQTKEQDKIPGEQLSEMDIGNLPGQKCRVMIIKMIQDFRKRMEAWNETMQEMFSRELEDIQNRVKE